MRGIGRLREQHGVRVLATGDMDLVGTMARNWIEECAEAAGVRAFLALWQADRASLLRRLLAERFLVFFSCVKSPWFEAGWVGRQLDAAAVSELETLAAQPPAPAAAGSGERYLEGSVPYPHGTAPIPYPPRYPNPRRAGQAARLGR